MTRARDACAWRTQVGHFGAGRYIHFFPRHIIVGVIGGFGCFLFITALEISTNLVGSVCYITDETW